VKVDKGFPDDKFVGILGVVVIYSWEKLEIAGAG